MTVTTKSRTLVLCQESGLRFAVVAWTLALALATSSAMAAPIIIINGDGNPETPFVSNDEGDGITSGQIVDGLGAAQVDFVTQNQSVTFQSSNPRPLLDDNSILSAEIFVTMTEVTIGNETAAQGEDRIRLVFRNPDDGTQETQWAAGLGWFPAANTWTKFSYDLTQESWWTNDYSDWEVFRVILFENNDDPYQNSFAIRNLQLEVPEPASLALMGLGSLMIITRRRRVAGAI